jgi:uncharacterized protein (TIGR03435 family)
VARRIAFFAGTFVAGLLNAAFGHAQSTVRDFDVASVKAAPDNRAWVGPRVDDPRRFEALTTAQQLIQWAYRVSSFQISGTGPAEFPIARSQPWSVPGWVGTERFEIQATTERPSNEEEMRQALKELLADRFQLKVHRETRKIRMYALVVGKNGPRLNEAKGESRCGADGCLWIGHGVLSADNVAMALFARILTENLDRPVLDETNLTGRYDFRLTYDGLGEPTPESTWTPIGPSIFTPIQSLGLRLEPREDPVEMLVIDRVERPTGN